LKKAGKRSKLQRCSEFNGREDDYIEELMALIQNNRDKVVAVGEFGLDYDRTQFCDKFELCEKTGLPLFLHCRAAAADFVEILQKNRTRLCGGVVHSFDGTAEERDQILALGFHIGINGCSLKSQDNLLVMKEIPNDKLMIETDCPWCEVKKSHAGYNLIKTKFDCYKAVDKKKWTEGATVKSRNEPHNILQVLEIIAAVKEEDISSLAQTYLDNTEQVFFNNLPK